MATNRREIELLISARDTTGRTFQQVSSSVKNLAQDIDRQAEAAQRGEAKLEDLRKTQQALQQLGRDLSAIQGQIDGYRKLADNVSKSKDAHQSAITALEAYRKSTESVEKLTAAQTRTLTGLEKKVESTAQAYRAAEGSVASAGQSLAKVGIETAKLETHQAQIIAQARQVGQSFITVGSAIDGFADNLRLAREAEQNLAASNALDRKIAEAAKLGDASRLVRLYAEAVDNVALADQRVAALTGFRQVGAMAAEASNDVARFNAQSEQMGTATSKIAAGLRAIINPGQAVLTTLDGIEAKIAELDTVLQTDGESVGKYSVALNQLSEASAALLRQGALVDTFRDQEGAVARARAEFERAQAELARVGQAMKLADAPTEELTRDLKLAETAFEQTGKALAVEEGRLTQLSGALKQADIDTENLINSQERLATAAGRAAAATAKGNSRLGRGGEKPGGLFGLNPFELQNLSFQLQDIFVGLSSGQKPLTVLIQQGTQIAGIFPGLISTVGRFALSWGPVAAAVGVAGFAIYKVVGNLDRLREAVGAVNLRGLTDFNPANIVSATRLLEKAGLSAAEAKKQIDAVLDATSDPGAFAAIIVNADAMAKKLGTDVPEAIKLQIDAFTGGIEATETLAAQTHLLTDEEVAHAAQLFETGKSAEAHTFIQDRLTGALQRQADLTSGVFTPAIKNLETAFKNFGNFLSTIFKYQIQAINEYIQNTIIGITFLTALLAGKGLDAARAEAVGAVAPKAGGGGGDKFDAQDQRNADFRRDLAEKELSDRKGITHEQRIQIAGAKALNDAQAKGVGTLEQQLAVDQARRQERRKIAEEDETAARSAASRARGAASRAAAAARREAAAARRLQNQQNSASDRLENELAKLSGTVAKGSTADLEQRLAAVDTKYRKIYETISKLRSLGVSAVGGRTLQQIEADAKVMEQQVRDQESIKFFNEQIAALETDRRTENEAIAAAQRSGAISVKEAYENALAVQSVIGPQIIANAKAALQIAQKARAELVAAGKAVPPELQAQIADATTTIVTQPQNQTANNVASSASQADEARLNTLLGDRNSLVAEYNTQLELGFITQKEATASSKAGWEASAVVIAEAAAKVRENVELLHSLKDESGQPLISDAAYSATLVRLDTINQQLGYTDENLKKIREAGEQAFAQGIVDGFHSIAEGIAGLITGTKSFGDAIGGVLTAALSLVAKFTQAIADAILQLIALQIAKQAVKAIGTALGIPIAHEGGVVGGGGWGGTTRSVGGSWIGAPRLHGGTGMALAPNEYKAVLKQGEEVLTEDDPRHIRNRGKGGSSAPHESIKQVLLFDPEEIPRAMQTKRGQKSVLTTIKSNVPTIKQMLGIKG